MLEVAVEGLDMRGFLRRGGEEGGEFGEREDGGEAGGGEEEVGEDGRFCCRWHFVYNPLVCNICRAIPSIV